MNLLKKVLPINTKKINELANDFHFNIHHLYGIAIRNAPVRLYCLRPMLAQALANT